MGYSIPLNSQLNHHFPYQIAITGRTPYVQTHIRFCFHVSCVFLLENLPKDRPHGLNGARSFCPLSLSEACCKVVSGLQTSVILEGSRTPHATASRVFGTWRLHGSFQLWCIRVDIHGFCPLATRLLLYVTWPPLLCRVRKHCGGHHLSPRRSTARSWPLQVVVPLSDQTNNPYRDWSDRLWSEVAMQSTSVQGFHNSLGPCRAIFQK